jgi:hypothetical protein
VEKLGFIYYEELVRERLAHGHPHSGKVNKGSFTLETGHHSRSIINTNRRCYMMGQLDPCGQGESDCEGGMQDAV